MKKILKIIGFYKLNNIMDLFFFNGTIENKEIKLRKMTTPVILTAGTIILLDIIFNNRFITLMSFMLLVSLLIFVFFTLIENEKVLSLSDKILKDLFKKKMKKTFKVDFENKEFKEYINTNYDYIIEQKLSKKETMILINTWNTGDSELHKILNERARLCKEIKEI